MLTLWNNDSYSPTYKWWNSCLENLVAFWIYTLNQWWESNPDSWWSGSHKPMVLTWVWCWKQQLLLVRATAWSKASSLELAWNKLSQDLGMGCDSWHEQNNSDFTWLSPKFPKDQSLLLWLRSQPMPWSTGLHTMVQKAFSEGQSEREGRCMGKSSQSSKDLNWRGQPLEGCLWALREWIGRISYDKM